MTDPRAIMAAQTNADWYAMMFDVHGLRYQRTSGAFCANDTPPSYHSWATSRFGLNHAIHRQVSDEQNHTVARSPQH